MKATLDRKRTAASEDGSKQEEASEEEKQTGESEQERDERTNEVRHSLSEIKLSN